MFAKAKPTSTIYVNGQWPKIFIVSGAEPQVLTDGVGNTRACDT